MKRIKSFLSVLLITAFLFCSFSVVVGINKYRMTLFVDKAGIFACESNGNTVTVRGVDNSTLNNYSFESNVFSYCVTGGKLYAVMPTNQASVLVAAEAKNGKIIKNTVVKTQHVSKSTKLCVDSGGRIYLSDNSNHIEIYDSAGKYIRTTSDRYLSFTVVNGRVYAVTASGIYKVDASSENLVCKCNCEGVIYTVSADCIATLSGDVYNVNTGKRVFSCSADGLYSIAAASNHFLALNGNAVDVYDKDSSEHINTYKLGFKPFAISAVGSKTCIIKDTEDLSVVEFKESNFLFSSSTKSDVSSTSLTEINFGIYKTMGKYIFLPPQTTRDEFRSEVKYDGYKLKFNKQSGMGTNTKAIFTKDNKSYIYTIIVMGDITGTGRINNNDITVMFNCLFGLDRVGGVYKTAADMNGDGKLSNIDLVMIDRKLN
ncbi:MAG: hypothetical protein K6F88_04065 [Ruminococcus sp.]|nr:hypothetical protein [Ruminococcus sp.]